MIGALIVVVLVAFLGYGLLKAFTPASYSDAIDFDIKGPQHVYPAPASELVDAYAKAALTIAGVAVTRLGSAALFVDAAPRWNRLDDGFGVLALFAFEEGAHGTTVVMRGRGKVGGWYASRASYATRELEREIRLAAREVTGMRPEDGEPFTWPADPPSLTRFRPAHAESVFVSGAPATRPPDSIDDVDATRPRQSQRGAPGPRLVVDGGSHELSSALVVGRRPEAATGESAVHVKDPTASRTHFAVGMSNGRLWVEDRGSANGTMVSDTSGRRADLTPNRKTLVPMPITIHYGSSTAQVVSQ